MIYSSLFKSILGIVNDPILEGEIEERFIPLYSNTRLVSAINNVSEKSPIFQEAIFNLREVTEKSSIKEFLLEYEKFHNTVMIICDELALTIKKEVDLIKDTSISLEDRNTFHTVSSRIFVGNSMLLMFTSNEELLHKTLENFISPKLKTKPVIKLPSA